MYGSIKDDFRRAWDKPNNAVAQIILINVIVFVVTGVFYIVGFDISRNWFGLPSNLSVIPTKIWTVITHMFVHDGFRHILFNMLFLYWFGKIIQEFLGSQKVIGLFVMGGLAGAVSFIAAYNLIPQYQEISEIATVVGASAGVTALIIGAAVFMPDYTIYLLLIGPAKIKYVALVAIFLFLIGARAGSNVGGEFAHLGGAAMGWLYMTQVKKGNDIGAWVISTMNFFKALFKPSPKIKVTHRSERKSQSSTSPAKGTRSDGTTQEEIDAIL
ncbi:MAG: rhomboid family intramembrane serine protease, partial [Cyclobacteriaceae bacterium]